MPFSPTEDLTGVAGLASMPNVLVVRPDRFKTLKDFVSAAKAKPNALTFGSLGIGATSYFNVKRLELSAGFQAVHVPFRGQPEVLSEVMAGRLDFAFAPEGAALPLIRSGKLRALAVSTPKRSPALPDVPTTTESGYANSDYWLWQGVFVSSKTPAPLVRVISREINQALSQPAVRTLYARLGVDPMDTPTPEAFEAVIKKEVTLDTALAKAAGLGKAPSQ
jgi:tripartite-type tricarboxylate transporter receptor subunit TctC